MGHAWRVRVWCLGVLLLLLSVLTAFVGYVLPWGQMSFWGATVITSPAAQKWDIQQVGLAGFVVLTHACRPWEHWGIGNTGKPRPR